MGEVEKLYTEFMNEYDDTNFEFNEINYRRGAKITESFCLAEGFKVLKDGSLEWGYARIHSGVDRGRGSTVDGTKNVIMSPFNFESSRFEDYNGKIYGTLVVLISEKYNFEFRIAHMHSDEILILDDLKNNKPVKRDTIIGSAGGYGVGSGVHTHTEVKSINKNSPTLERLLNEKYGSKEVASQYTKKEVVNFYRSMRMFTFSSNLSIFADYSEQMKKRRCFFANKYLYRYEDFDGKDKTRYSSELLWNKL